MRTVTRHSHRRHHGRRVVAMVLVAGALLAGCGDDAGDTATQVDAPVGDTATSAVTSTSVVDTTEAAVSDAATYEFTIPAGTGAKIDAGEEVTVLPELLVVQTGDLILIHNQDQRNHVVGPFFVPADDTMEHTFVTTGEFAGACSAHTSGQITVVVT
jgi:plastocyanin